MSQTGTFPVGIGNKTTPYPLEILHDGLAINLPDRWSRQKEMASRAEDD